MGKCSWIAAIAGGVLAAASVTSAETTVSTKTVSAKTQGGAISATKATLKNSNARPIVALAPAPEDLDGPTAAKLAAAAPKQVELAGPPSASAVFCGACDPNAVNALEPAYDPTNFPFTWTAAPGNGFLANEGCFTIITCIPGQTLPAAQQLGNFSGPFKICTRVGNMNALNDLTTANLNTAVYPNPACPGNPTTQTNLRDQDCFKFRAVTPIDNFRLLVTSEIAFNAILYVANNAAGNGDDKIDNCSQAGATPAGEFGWIFGGTDNSATNAAPEGNKQTTWAWPRAGATQLPVGDYIIAVRPIAATSTSPLWEGPYPFTSKIQIEVQGSGAAGGTGACCNISSNACTNGVDQTTCATSGGAWRGDGSTCATLVPACGLACSGTVEAASGTCNESDTNAGCNATTGLPLDSIDCGDTICGNLGIYQATGGTSRDLDWFQYLNGSAVAQQITVTFDFDGAPLIFFGYPGATSGQECNDLYAYGFGADARTATPLTITACVPAGQEVWVITAVNNFSDLPCSARYKLTFSCAAPCQQGACCSISTGNCTQASGLDCYNNGGIFLGEGVACATGSCCHSTACTGSTGNEGETACYNSNGLASGTEIDSGCTLLPPVFATAACGNKICGTSSMSRNIVDEDWYQVNLTSEVYLGAILNAEFDADITLYAAPAAGCPSDITTLGAISSDSVGACGGQVVVGDCLPVGNYYIRVNPSFTNVYGVPCGARYLLEIFCGPCVSTITCTGTAEGEVGCSTQSNGGCNNDGTPTFGTIACGSTICGNAELVAGTRDTDWFKLTHPGGPLTVSLKSEFYGDLFVAKPGVAGPGPGCDDLTIVDGLALTTAGTAESLTISSLAAGTYWIIVAPDFDGSSRVCCGTKYELKVVCTPPCPCSADLTGNCVVNTQDLTLLLGNFGKSCPAQLPCPIVGDIDGNNTVNTADLTTLLGQFGKQNVNGVCALP